MKQFILKTIRAMLVLAIIFTGIPAIQAQAASKPVISSSQVTIKKNSCSVEKGRKIKLSAKYGKKNITKKATWKSSKKSVAAISKTGVLTAKKAGTAYITVKYKGKTSKKLKAIVKDSTKPEPEPDESTEPTPAPNITPGQGFTITYNKNSKNKSDKLNGSSAQKVSGEIIKFSTTVNPGSGRKFLGWFTEPEGGKQVYETYVPDQNMTLYAHYANADQNVQQVKFSLGCNYGYADDVSFMMSDGYGYDWKNKKLGVSPFEPFWNESLSDNSGAIKDRVWTHNYVVDEKSTFTVDDLPTPSIPGYEFKGWYTVDQSQNGDAPTIPFNSGVKIENGQKVDTSVTRLYARFSKKITISFDDLHGGKYDDIVIDTYTSIADAGFRLPIVDIPGTTFTGWSRNADLGDVMFDSIVTNDTAFTNVFYIHGYQCSDINEESYFTIHYRELIAHWIQAHGELGAYNDEDFYWESDRITLYPTYKTQHFYLPFDPKGGSFLSAALQPVNVTVYKEDVLDFKKGIGYMANMFGDSPYGEGIYYVGHEGQPGWKRGNGYTAMPKVTRKNYQFAGWYLDDDTPFTYDTILVDDMYVYAKWNPGTCYVMFDPTDGTLTKDERDRVGLDGSWSYKVTTESTIGKDGKQLPVPVSSEGRAFEGWFTEDGEPFTLDTQILADTYVVAHWGPLPKDLPVTLKSNAGGGTFKNKGSDGTEVNIKTKTITRGENFGQFPELENRQDYDFMGWYIVKKDAAEPYTEDSFLQKATETTRPNALMISDEDEILLYV